MPQEIQVASWVDLRDKWLSFSKLPRTRRNDWWFRGQANSKYEIIATIDRNKPFFNDFQREEYILDLLYEFRREILALNGPDSEVPNDAFELLARHHGLPSPLIDWTRSPWIASYFAFANAEALPNHKIAVYALDRLKIPSQVLDPQAKSARSQIEMIDNPKSLHRNARAIHQRGVFLRQSTITQPLESIVDKALTKFILPATEKNLALGDLDQMLLNETHLMYDPDGAAKTASRRLHRM